MPTNVKINAAIHECLNALKPGGSLIAHLADYVNRLHQDRSWTAEEIREFESNVRRILATLATEPDLAVDYSAE